MLRSLGIKKNIDLTATDAIFNEDSTVKYHLLTNIVCSKRTVKDSVKWMMKSSISWSLSVHWPFLIVAHKKYKMENV